ncbi:MAG: HigA family addiction module antidote protein [Prevotellaceae bacterium]|nr:HigA family addiction module antidote protein [Candidatus Minthosoma caballi]
MATQKFSANDATPFVATHPGEIIKDELEFRRISQRQFAKEIGVSYSQLNEMLNKKRQLTPEMALLIEAVLGVNAAPLLRIQMDYNLQQTKNSPTFLQRLSALRRVAAVF